MPIMNNNNLKDALLREGYICDARLALAVEVALAVRPTPGAFLFGPAGSGKTALAETLARIEAGEKYFFQCFPGTREDDLLVKMLPSESTVSGIALHDGVISQAIRACRRKGARPVYLILDEWDKTRPSADSFLLDFLQSGRVNFNGHSAQLSPEQAARLRVFITLNDEREISEPLLRRLPLIEFSHLPVSRVREALEMSHPAHPFIPAALVLYERCIAARMSKPATIQELRQLLDAISILGNRADWDSLVFQFVTKTRENHALLKRAESIELRAHVEERDKLDPSAFESTPTMEEQEEEPPPTPRLPRLAEIRGMTSVAATAEASDRPVDLSSVGGVVQLSDDTYDAAVALATAPNESPHKIGEVAEVVGEQIVLWQSLPLRDYRKIDALWGQTGEIVFVEKKAQLEDVLALRKQGWKIVKYCRTEILAKHDGADLRWTPDGGAEIVVDLARAKQTMQQTAIVGFPRYQCDMNFSVRTKLWRCDCETAQCSIFAKRNAPPPPPPPPPKSEQQRTAIVSQLNDKKELKQFFELCAGAVHAIWDDPDKIRIDKTDGEILSSIIIPNCCRFYPDPQKNQGDYAKVKSAGIFAGHRSKVRDFFTSHEKEIREQYIKYVEHFGSDLSKWWSWAGIDLQKEFAIGQKKYLQRLYETAKKETENAA